MPCAAEDALPAESPITEGDREHWSLQPITKPELPPIHDSSWPLQPIDYFILSRLEEQGLAPSSEASRQVLLRRVVFDLHGLPATLEQLQSFVDDSSPNAYVGRVDQWLASPAFGERWSQHWLDLARFAETDGFEHDKVREGAWRYRDWVIRALNDGVPYDEFVSRQLLGDSSAGDDEIATMFCLAGPDMPDINEQDLRRHDKLNEITSTVGSALLGMQFHCAQCHDHKYDAISQLDFYRLRAVFEPSVPLMKRDKHLLVMNDQGQVPPPRFYHRGDLSGAGGVVPAGFPRLATSADRSHLCATEDYRAEFCNWMFDRQNPLAARVIANRIWQHHFGKSLTGNPSDFGVVESEPTHPELLDWLAAELIDHHWDMKHLHRIILCSATYRQAGLSHASKESVTVDPTANLYSRFPGRRLDGEAVRDALLAVSGQLNFEMHGESVRPPMPPEMLSTLLKGQWKESPNRADHARRSIYVFARRNLRYPIFDVFDRPDAGASCAIRNQSTTAIQSLHLLNGALTVECAERLAQRLLQGRPEESSTETSHDLFRELMLTTLGRTPSSDELLWFSEAMRGAKDREAALLPICVAIFNTSEFVYVD